jgi:VWFA-related protein
MIPRTLLTILSLGCLSVSALPAQPDTTFDEAVDVNEVLLDVLVTDKSGNVVVGLDKSDFIIEENGSPVDVTHVSFYSTRYSPSHLSEGAVQEVPASRYFILYFHDQRFASDARNQLLRRQLDAGRYSRRWVENDMKASDWVAVVSYGVKLQVHQDFTQNPAAITEAITAASTGKNANPDWRQDLVPPGQPSLLRYLPDGKKLRKETGKMYDGVRLVADASGHIVGRKNLLLFSTGFGEISPGGFTARPDERYYPAMEQALNDNNVAVYPIDLTPIGVEHLQSQFLNVLADDTGGYYYKNFVNFATPIEQIADENTGYYLISYRAEHPRGKSGYQEVKVRAKQKGVNVRAQKGYRYGADS